MQLCAADNIANAEFDAATTLCKRVVFEDSDSVMTCSLLEDASSFKERYHFDGGAIAVQHKLTLVADRNMAAVWLESSFHHECMRKGVCAVVTMNDGRQLLVGISARFGTEQPLRPIEIISSSGSRLSDVPTITFTLESYDTSPAALLGSD